MGKANVASGAPTVTILFISLSPAQGNLEADWAEAGAEGMLRRCPICEQDSIAAFAVDGQVLVIPKEHVPTIHALPMAVQKAVWTMVSRRRSDR